MYRSLCTGLLIIGATLSLVWAEPYQVSVAELSTVPLRYLHRQVVVQGTVRLLGGRYYTHPHFVLADDSGHAVPITAWAPLEIPPPPPGRTPAMRIPTMRDYLGRRIRLFGTVMVSPHDATPLLAVERALPAPE